MKLKKRSGPNIASIFILLLFVIGIGYAYITSNLSITGATTVAGNTWDIHFENIRVSNGSVEAVTPATIDPDDNTLVNYAVLLEKPGDFYEFTVDIVNAGTLPGKVTLVELNGITSDVEDVIDYSIIYTYRKKPVELNDIINAESFKNIKVRVYYKDDIDNEDLIASDVNLTLSFDVTYNQSDRSEPTLNTIVKELIANNSNCFIKYNGQVTDEVGETVSASKVYFNKCDDKRNIIFHGYCWQMIRTTEADGLKVIYNGEPDGNGECGTNRAYHKGIVGTDGTIQQLNTNYLYGDSFIYDTTTNKFTLNNTFKAKWGPTTYNNIIGKFTCKSNNNVCTNMYQIGGYSSPYEGFASSYVITSTHFAQIGTSPFNASDKNPSMAGYMFNKEYTLEEDLLNNAENRYGSTFTYDISTDTYTLSGTIQDYNRWSNSYAKLYGNHYTCWNTSGTCSVLSYIFYSSSSEVRYINLSGGKSVEDAIEEMLTADDVNTYNSNAKGIIDSWYNQNLSERENMLKDAVYCNSRYITNLGGWRPIGGNTTSNYYLQFKNYNQAIDLRCHNETDQFSMSNDKAKLTYPVSLLQNEERSNSNSSLTQTGTQWWTLSPAYFNNSSLVGKYDISGGYSNSSINRSFGLRPVIALNLKDVIIGGTGIETDPWVVE